MTSIRKIISKKSFIFKCLLILSVSTCKYSQNVKIWSDSDYLLEVLPSKILCKKKEFMSYSYIRDRFAYLHTRGM